MSGDQQSPENGAEEQETCEERSSEERTLMAPLTKLLPEILEDAFCYTGNRLAYLNAVLLVTVPHKLLPSRHLPLLTSSVLIPEVCLMNLTAG